jgi:hypothetical protein
LWTIFLTSLLSYWLAQFISITNLLSYWLAQFISITNLLSYWLAQFISITNYFPIGWHSLFLLPTYFPIGWHSLFLLPTYFPIGCTVYFYSGILYAGSARNLASQRAGHLADKTPLPTPLERGAPALNSPAKYIRIFSCRVQLAFPCIKVNLFSHKCVLLLTCLTSELVHYIICTIIYSVPVIRPWSLAYTVLQYNHTFNPIYYIY